MNASRPLLLVGFPDPPPAAYRDLAASIGHELVAVDSGEKASHWLDHNDPHAIAVDMQASFAEAVCLRARRDAKLANIPIIGLAAQVNDLAFPEIYGWGGDDVVRADSPAALATRLRTLADDTSLHPPPSRGTAVVASSDRRRRVVLARVMKNAGYDVHFAVSGAETEGASMLAGVKLVVADAEIGTERGAAGPKACRAAGGKAPWVLMSEPRKMAAARAAIADVAKVAVTDAFAPPENVLFVANELGRDGATEGRASPRILYGTVIAFRAAGRDEDALGFSYNVSAGGLYVRTLAPLSSGDEVWIEMLPPRSDRRIRLEGTVVWRRRFGPIESATVPPGFGVRFVDGSDRNRFQTGYESFLTDTVGRAT